MLAEIKVYYKHFFDELDINLFSNLPLLLLNS